MLETVILATQGTVIASYIISLIGLIIQDVGGIQSGKPPVPSSMYVYPIIRYSFWVYLVSIALKVVIEPVTPTSLILYSIGLFLITFILSMVAEVIIRFLVVYVSSRVSKPKEEPDNLNDIYDTYGKDEG